MQTISSLSDSFNSSLQSLRQQLFSLKEKNLETLAQKKQAFQTSMSSMEEGLDMLAKDNEKLVSSINVKDEELHHLENIYKYEKTTDSRRQSEKHALSQETRQELLELLDNQKKMSSLLSIEENQENSLLNQEEACYKEALNIYEDIMGLKIIKKDEKILQIRLKTKGEGGWWRKDGGERREKAGGREEEGERRKEKEGGREEEGWRRREKEGGRKKEDERGRWEGEEWDDRAEGLGLIELVFEKDKGWRVGKFEDADAREEGERLGKDGRLDIFVKKMRRKIC